MLGKIADIQQLGILAEAPQQRQIADQGFNQGGFSGAVHAQQADAAAWGNLQIDIGDNQLIAIADIGMLQLQQRRTHFGRLTEAEGERRIDMGSRQFLHALQLLDAALRLLGFGGLSFKAVNIFLQVRAGFQLLLIGLLLLRQALAAGALKSGIIAGV